jgi:hypothetical protein
MDQRPTQDRKGRRVDSRLKRLAFDHSVVAVAVEDLQRAGWPVEALACQMEGRMGEKDQDQSIGH